MEERDGGKRWRKEMVERDGGIDEQMKKAFNKLLDIMEN